MDQFLHLGFWSHQLGLEITNKKLHLDSLSHLLHPCRSHLGAAISIPKIWRERCENFQKVILTYGFTYQIEGSDNGFKGRVISRQSERSDITFSISSVRSKRQLLIQVLVSDWRLHRTWAKLWKDIRFQVGPQHSQNDFTSNIAGLLWPRMLISYFFVYILNQWDKRVQHYTSRE